MKNIKTLLLATLAVSASITSYAKTINYQLVVDKKQLGTISASYTTEKSGKYSLKRTSHINVPGLLKDEKLESTVTETYSPQGKLLKSSYKVRYKNKIYWTKLELHGKEFLAFQSEITNDSQKEDEQLVEFTKGVVADMVPGAGEVMLINDILDENQPSNDRFTSDSFDTSFSNLPFLWKKSNYELPKKLRLLDTEDMGIFPVDVVFQGIETVSLKNKKITASHFKLLSKDSKPTEIWLALDEAKKPFFYKITGHEDGDDYAIVPVSQ